MRLEPKRKFHRRRPPPLFDRAAAPTLFADELFDELRPPTNEILARLKITKNFPPEALLFAAGDAPAGVFVLLEGRARFFSAAGTGERIIAPREILGLTELLADLRFESSVRAVTPCVCEYFDGQELVEFLRGEPEVSFRLVRKLDLNLLKIYKTLRS